MAEQPCGFPLQFCHQTPGITHKKQRGRALWWFAGPVLYYRPALGQLTLSCHQTSRAGLAVALPASLITWRGAEGFFDNVEYSDTSIVPSYSFIELNAVCPLFSHSWALSECETGQTVLSLNNSSVWDDHWNALNLLGINIKWIYIG